MKRMEGIMKLIKSLLVFFALFSLLFVSSCVSTQLGKQTPEKRIKYDKVYATYPKYRIDPPIRKIIIVGSGEGRSVISARLTEIFMVWISPSIRVIEPGSLEAIFGGRIIEYGTGLTKEESQAISQMLQVDHILFFNAITSPHQDYMYGGKFSTRLYLKIINTRSGEIVFQTSKEWGVNFPDPRPAFSHVSPNTSAKGRMVCFQMIDFELRYALGSIRTGLLFVPSQDRLVVNEIFMNSPADKAGIQKGDNIIEINDNKIHNYSEYEEFCKRLSLKQGDHWKIKLERDGGILEVDLNFPVIPKPPLKKRYEKIDKEQKPAGPRI
jgi:hypothetical protein